MLGLLPYFHAPNARGVSGTEVFGNSRVEEICSRHEDYSFSKKGTEILKPIAVHTNAVVHFLRDMRRLTWDGNGSIFEACFDLPSSVSI